MKGWISSIPWKTKDWTPKVNYHNSKIGGAKEVVLTREKSDTRLIENFPRH